jgi:RNase H-fold protein (predicted Holliday junction resolvase)
MGLKRGEREQKERIDAAAAALILDAYLRQRDREAQG